MALLLDRTIQKKVLVAMTREIKRNGASPSELVTVGLFAMY